MKTSKTCLASIAVSALVLAGMPAPASAASLPMTLSNTVGPSGGGNFVIGTITTNAATPVPIVAGTVPTVQFQFVGTGAPACSPMAKAVTQIAATGTTTTAGVLTVDPANVKRVSGNRIAFRVPSASYPPSGVNANGLVVVGAQASSRWSVCVYDNDSTNASALLANSLYTVVAKPAITSILPLAGPAAGGTTITVNGTGFATTSTPLTASIGGTPLTNIKVAANGASFTGVTGARSPGAGLELTVTTPGGTVGSLDPDGDPNTVNDPISFEYTNGITVTPNHSPVGKTVTVDIRGVGFDRLDFGPGGGTATSSYAHVFLVSGAYAAGGNRGVAECRDAVVLSNTTLVCTLDLSVDRLNPATSASVGGQAIPEGAYFLTVVEDGSTIAGLAANPTVMSTGSVFVVAPY